MRRECPYCREELREEDAFYLFHWTKDEEGRKAKTDYTELAEFLEEFTAISDQRKKDRFDKIWKNYNYHDSNDLPFSPYDILLSQEEVGRLKKFLEHPHKQREEGNSAYPMLPVLGDSSRNQGLMRTNRNGENSEETAPDQKEAEKWYFYQKKNRDDEFDHQMEISYGMRDFVIAKVRRVCGKCYNLIPDELYLYDVIRVYLMATPGSGKTSMLYSIFLHQDAFNSENGRYMSWESIQDISMDPFFRNFLNCAEKFKKEDREIVPTSVRFIPPLFLKVRYREKENEQIVILALYDNGGEIFLDDDSEMAKEFAELFNQKVKGMDALMCLVSPEERQKEDNRYELRLKEAEIKNILKNSRIYTTDEQRKIEDNPLETEMTVSEILEELSERNSVSKESGREILKTLEHSLGGEVNMREIIKDKYFSLVVSKIDTLSRSSLFQDEERALFFDDVSMYFSEEEKRRKAERDWKMIRMIEEENLIEYDLNRFRACNYHYIAAFVKEQKKFRPIRIEEPLIGIVRDYFQ